MQQQRPGGGSGPAGGGPNGAAAATGGGGGGAGANNGRVGQAGVNQQQRPGGMTGTAGASQQHQQAQQRGIPTNPLVGTAAQRQQQQQQQQQQAAAASAQQQQQQANGAGSYRPLNVKDALSYLDSVKNQFHDRPQIYNNFLDIMKDFKTQNIDTPGVIDRVSSLFRGHPSLIQGFNTFLPPGYRIDCAFDASGKDIITITTPTTVTRRDANGNQIVGASGVGASASGAGAGAAARSQPGGISATSSAAQQAKPALGANTTNAATAAGQQPSAAAANASKGPSPFSGGIAGIGSQAGRPGAAGPAPGQQQAGATSGVRPGAPGASTAAQPGGAGAASNNSSLNSYLGYSRPGLAAIAASRPPAEFNHAISFVNKIKSRFSTRPDTYKSFLEILQTYQKEQRSIQEVYKQVTILFREAPDLLEEFKEFLPDHSGSAGLSAGQSTAINQASANAASASATPAPPQSSVASSGPPAGGAGAGSVANAATATNAAAAANTNNNNNNRLGRNTSTTSLFGVNASSTSQPQAGAVPSYLHSAQRDRARVAGQPLGGGVGVGVGGGASLDVAASRRQMLPESAVAAQVPKPAAAQASQAAVGAAGAAGGPAADKTVVDDEEWQASGSAKKRKGAAPNTAEKSKGKRSKYVGGDESPDEAAPAYGANRTFAPGYPAAAAANAVPPPVQPIILPHALRPHGPRSQIQPMVSSEELSLFDRIKKYIDDKTTYHEFLKLLNLYTSEIIDMPTLLEKAFLYIGGSDETFGLFREFVGEQDGFVEGEEWPIDNAPALERERIELFTLKSYGPSYRKLPYIESKGLACSGRDALCWSVLNDDWVAFATWASEGSGAHRKNAYEDALACSEQERHWYDHHLESIRRAIAVLEPVVARINQMTAEEKATLRLKPGLGGESTSFYERTIRKIYGKDQGYEAIQSLYDSPAIAAPIISSRLKQKDEEWHRALREWNRVWREVDAKNFYRSLDHQGLTFKTNDKKTTTSKYLVSEIENLRRDQQQKRVFPAHLATNTESLRPRHQFEMHIGDVDVVFDVLKLIFSYLDRASTSYASKERVAIENTLRRMVPLLFNIGEKEVEANLAPAIIFGDEGDNGETDNGESDVDDATGMSDAGASASEASGTSTPTGLKKGKKSAADLRKKLLTSAVTGINGQGGPAAADDNAEETAGASADLTTEAGLTLDETSWINASSQPLHRAGSAVYGGTVASSPSKLKGRAFPSPKPAVPEEPVQRSVTDYETPRYNFFVSQPFYCFIRLFQLLYHRLATLKHIATELAQSQTKSSEERLNPFAVELGLAVPIPNIDEPGVPRGKNFYEFMLELCERYFDAEIDSATFEENLRYMWGIKAFPAFTVDKLVGSMIKHAHAINSDQRCQDLINLLAKDREIERTSLRHEIAYRHTAEAVIGSDDTIYRLEWIPSSSILTIQLLSSNDLTIDDPVIDSDKRWAHYLDTYTLSLPTEGLRSPIQGPLLDRNRSSNTQRASNLQGKSDLAIRFGYDDFRMTFVGQTEETVFKDIPNDEEAIEKVKSSRRDAWDKWLATQTEEDAAAPQDVPADAAHRQEAEGGDTIAALPSQAEETSVPMAVDEP